MVLKAQLLQMDLLFPLAPMDLLRPGFLGFPDSL